MTLCHLFLPTWLILTGLAPSRLDVETPAEREERLASAAYWCTTYARSYDELAACVTLGTLESRWAIYVWQGRCSDGPVGERCDEGRARGPWQQHRAACPALWRTEPGSPAAIQAGARCAVGLWRSARRRCRGRHPRGELAGGYAGYRGASCTWVGGPLNGVRARVKTHAWVLRELGRRRAAE